MNQNSVKTIGINDEPRKDSNLVYVNQADGLKGILNRDFDEWSNFDSWESISVQQWIFSRALEVYKGIKIDIKCDCCEYNNDYFFYLIIHVIPFVVILYIFYIHSIVFFSFLGLSHS